MDIIEQLKRDEAFRQYPYRDNRNILTIGYGFNLGTVGFSEPESAAILALRVSKLQHDLQELLPWSGDLDTPRFGVLLNMAYNMGTADLLGFHEMLSALQAKDYAGAAAAMQASLWYTETGNRAKRLVQQMITGVWQ